MANTLTAYYIELDLPGFSRKSMDSSAEPHFKIKHQQTNALKSFKENSFWSFMFICYLNPVVCWIWVPNPIFNFKYQLLYLKNN